MKPKPRKPGLVVDSNAYSSAENTASINYEKYTCRICFEESEDSSQLISPCLCKGILTCAILGSMRSQQAAPLLAPKHEKKAIRVSNACARVSSAMIASRCKVLGLSLPEHPIFHQLRCSVP